VSENDPTASPSDNGKSFSAKLKRGIGQHTGRLRRQREQQYHEGSPLKRVIASFALLLGLTFVTLTLYLGNVEVVGRILEAYAVAFP